MGVKCRDIADFIESFAPASLAEDWDNIGLLLGNANQEVNRILVCLDVTPGVVDEAVHRKADLIISHHPLIFKGLKRITRDDVKGEMVYRLISNNIGVYSAHTNLDAAEGGLNDHLAALLGLKDIKNLKGYKAEKLYKVVVFVPVESTDKVRNAMCEAGAGWIGNYSHCTFMTPGTGTFFPREGTNPYIGSHGSLEKVEEYRLETIVPQKLLKSVIDAMIDSHPYEEAAYDIYPLELAGKEYGLGKVGTLKNPLSLDDFISIVKEKLEVAEIRLIGKTESKVERVAVFSGAFDDSCIGAAKSKADVLVTGDLKYHTAVDMAEMGMCVIDAGHYATERIMVPYLARIISDKFTGLDVIPYNMDENPFKII